MGDPSLYLTPTDPKATSQNLYNVEDFFVLSTHKIALTGELDSLPQG